MVIVHWLPAVRPRAECDERVRPELYAARVRTLLAATLSSSMDGDNVHGCADESPPGASSLDSVDDVRLLLSSISPQSGANASSGETRIIGGDCSTPYAIAAAGTASELRIHNGVASPNVHTPLELAQHVDTAHRLHNLFARFVPPPTPYAFAATSSPSPISSALRVSQMILLPPRVCLTLFADFARFDGGRSDGRLAFHEFCAALGAASAAPLARTLFATFLNAASSSKFAAGTSSCTSSASLMDFAATSWQPPRSHSGDEANNYFSSAALSRAKHSTPGDASHQSNDCNVTDSEEVDDDLKLDYRWLIVSIALAPHTTAVRDCLGSASTTTTDTAAASHLISSLSSPSRKKAHVALQRPIALPSWTACAVASATLSASSSSEVAVEPTLISPTDHATLITHVDKCLDWTLQCVLAFQKNHFVFSHQ